MKEVSAAVFVGAVRSLQTTTPVCHTDAFIAVNIAMLLAPENRKE